MTFAHDGYMLSAFAIQSLIRRCGKLSVFAALRQCLGPRITMRMTLPNTETRAAMLATGMEHAMEVSYVRLETLI